MRYVPGSNMATHVDTFDTILTRLSHCNFIPSESEKLDWFLDSVPDPKYSYVREHSEHL